MLTSHQFNETVLREYDIRGIVDDTLTIKDAYAIGRAFGTIVKKNNGRRIAVGYDGRLSSPELSKHLCQGVVNAGIDVELIGLGPTPMLYFAVHELATDGGIQITGSHNPADYNGFKMMLGTRSFYGAQIQELGRIAQNGSWASGTGIVTAHEIMDDYIARILRDFHGTRPIDVVWDAGNGAAGPVMERIAAAIPGRHRLLFADIDGNFPNHHPDPTEPENLVDLIREVTEGNFEIGIGFDGDGDRIGVVDGQGRIVWGDQILQLLAADILPNYPGGTVIADVKASNTLFDAIRTMGGTPLMYKTGHSLIKEKMIETKSPLSGEMSGHIFYKDSFFGHDDALYVAIRLLDILSRGQSTIEDFANGLPIIHNTPEIRIDCLEAEKFAIIDGIKKLLGASGADFDTTDGVRVSNSEGWWLLRASNTQAVLVARIESGSLEGLERGKAELNKYLARSGFSYQI